MHNNFVQKNSFNIVLDSRQLLVVPSTYPTPNTWYKYDAV